MSRPSALSERADTRTDTGADTAEHRPAGGARAWVMTLRMTTVLAVIVAVAGIIRATNDDHSTLLPIVAFVVAAIGTAAAFLLNIGGARAARAERAPLDPQTIWLLTIRITALAAVGVGIGGAVRAVKQGGIGLQATAVGVALAVLFAASGHPSAVRPAAAGAVPTDHEAASLAPSVEETA